MNHPDYLATVVWQRAGGAKFTDNRYSRAHEWRFDGGAVVAGSPSPHTVPPPLSNPAGVDPEEALVAALSSCHMLFFLFHAAKKGYVVEQYEDDAIGRMGKNAQGRTALVEFILRPAILWSGELQPDAEEIRALHEAAHHDCYIANTVSAQVQIEPR